MTLYAPTDVRAVTVPTDRGGCGQPHTAPDDLPEGANMQVDCPLCEPHLTTLAGHGWASDVLGVGLTPDERRHQDVLRDKAQAAQASTWADPNAIGKAVADALRGAGAPPEGGLLAQLRAEVAGLDEAGRAEFAAALGLTTAPTIEPPAAADPAPTAPVDPAPGLPPELARPTTPAKRGPGRPPKAHTGGA